MAALILLGGCDSVPTSRFNQVQRESLAAQEKAGQLEEQLGIEQRTVRNLQAQLARSRGLTPETLEQLVTPVRLTLERQSGGYDQDKKPGDDGLVLYVQPIDADGDVIKAAGSLQVVLLNLSEPTNPRVVSTYDFDVPTSRKMWYGRLMTNHFTVRCPWPPDGPPPVDEVTARVEFTDLLTGRVLVAQERYPIRRAPIITSQPGR
jgi:hypothetical protein